MFYTRTNRILLCSTILSSVLSASIIALTIYHHFTVQKKLDDLKGK
ncbi:hypothetical protein ACJROX_23855 [Pseudalkalibacillus sp. A8]